MSVKLTTSIFTGVAAVGCMAAATRSGFSPWGYVLSGAAVLAIVLVIGHDLSRRLWALQRLLEVQRRATVIEARKSAINCAVEVNAIMAVRERFPGLNIPTSGYSMRFANLLTVLDLLDTHSPTMVVEFGSGISTLCVAAWMRDHGLGTIISYEHDERWAEITRRHLERSGLGSYAVVQTAPLADYSHSEGSTRWYQIDEQQWANGPIDMMIIDGPPADSNPDGMGRLPALDVFADRLSANAVVILDDANRSAEQAIVAHWKAAMPELEAAFVPSMTGICILQRHRESAMCGTVIHHS
jgi:predicted O-methyltransferase YrrM